MARFESPGPVYLGKVTTVSSNFEIYFVFDEIYLRGKLVVTNNSSGSVTARVLGPILAEFLDPEIPTNLNVAFYSITDEVFHALYKSATEYCYSWSADHLNAARNNLEVDRNAIFTQQTNTHFDIRDDVKKIRDTHIEIANTHHNTLTDLRDDIRSITHRAVNVDEGIYTQRACWETQCEENKATRVSMMERTWIKAVDDHNNEVGYRSLMQDYLEGKTRFRTHDHVEDVSDDVPHVTPRTAETINVPTDPDRTSGSVDTSGNTA